MSKGPKSRKSLTKQLDAFDDWFGEINQTTDDSPAAEPKKEVVHHSDLYASVAGGCYLEDEDEDDKAKAKAKKGPKRGGLSRKKSGALESMLIGKQSKMHRSSSTGTDNRPKGGTSIMNSSAAARAKESLNARKSASNVKTSRRRSVGAALDRFLVSSDDDDEEPSHSSGGSSDNVTTSESGSSKRDKKTSPSGSAKPNKKIQRRSTMNMISEDDHKEQQAVPATPKTTKQKGMTRVQSANALSSSVHGAPRTPIPSNKRASTTRSSSSSTATERVPSKASSSSSPASPSKSTTERVPSKASSSSMERVPATPRRTGMPPRASSTTKIADALALSPEPAHAPRQSSQRDLSSSSTGTSATNRYVLATPKRETPKIGRRSTVADSMAEQLGLTSNPLGISTSRHSSHSRPGGGGDLSRSSHGSRRRGSLGNMGGSGRDELSSSQGGQGISRSLHMNRVSSVGCLDLGSRSSHGSLGPRRGRRPGSSTESRSSNTGDDEGAQSGGETPRGGYGLSRSRQRSTSDMNRSSHGRSRSTSRSAESRRRSGTSLEPKPRSMRGGLGRSEHGGGGGGGSSRRLGGLSRTDHGGGGSSRRLNAKRSSSSTRGDRSSHHRERASSSRNLTTEKVGMTATTPNNERINVTLHVDESGGVRAIIDGAMQ